MNRLLDRQSITAECGAAVMAGRASARPVVGSRREPTTSLMPRMTSVIVTTPSLHGVFRAGEWLGVNFGGLDFGDLADEDGVGIRNRGGADGHDRDERVRNAGRRREAGNDDCQSQEFLLHRGVSQVVCCFT